MDCRIITECKWGEFLMSDYLVTDTELTSVADAIRAKGGTSANLSFPTGFVSAINDISTGASNIVSGTLTTTFDRTANVVIATPTDLGLTATQVSNARGFYICANQTVTTAKYMVGSVYLQYGTKHWKTAYYKDTKGSVSTINGTSNWESNSVGYVYYSASAQQIIWRGGTSYIIGKGTYDWVLLLPTT